MWYFCTLRFRLVTSYLLLHDTDMASKIRDVENLPTGTSQDLPFLHVKEYSFICSPMWRWLIEGYTYFLQIVMGTPSSDSRHWSSISEICHDHMHYDVEK